MAGLGLINRRRAIASSPTAGKSVEDLLPHLIFRWSVKGQGATNESLAANPTLIDLTGNGFDLPLTGFTFDGSTNGVMTDEDGEQYLRFAASPVCYASKAFGSLGFPMSDFADYTIVVKRRWFTAGNYEYLLAIFGGNSNHWLCKFEAYATRANLTTSSRGYRPTAMNVNEVVNRNKSIVWQVTDSYNGLLELPYTDANYGNINSISMGNTANKGSFGIYDILLFNKKLDEKEIASIVKYFEI